jgi:hypothetical protein
MVTAMPERTSDPQVIPYLLYADAGAAMDWLIKTFAFTERVRDKRSDGTVRHGELLDNGGVEDVRGPLGAHADVLRGRPVRGIHRIPSRTIRLRIANLRRLTVRSPERLVVLLVATPLDRIRSRGRNLATRNLPLGPGEIVIRPV